MAFSKRIVAVDVARGIALIGMFVTHLDIDTEFSMAEPSTWIHVADGRAANLFVVVAGISLALMSGGSSPTSDVRPVRVRILGRAVFLFVVGGMLTWLQTPVAVILEFYALYFVLALPALRWRRRTLLIVAAALMCLGGTVIEFVYLVTPWIWTNGVGRLLFGGSYPAATWMAFVLIGIAIGRTRFDRVSTAFVWVVGGGVLLALGLLLESGARTLIDPSIALMVRNLDFGTNLRTAFFAALVSDDRSTSPFVMISVVGAVLLAMGMCILAVRYLRVICIPFASVGRMSLTMYCTHVIAISIVMWQPAYEDGAYLWPFIIVALLLATLWFLRFKQGPLEAEMRRIVGTLA